MPTESALKSAPCPWKVSSTAPAPVLPTLKLMKFCFPTPVVCLT